ncbi:transposase, partial [Psychrobacter sanguinis]
MEFLEQLKQFEATARPIIYIDESGFKSHDYRPYGYAKKGEKCFGKCNWQLKNKTNAIGAIHDNELFAVGLYDCSINSDIFHSWVEQLLLVEIPSNSVIVMDNASFHKRQETKE